MDKKRARGVALFTSVLLHSLLALLPWQEKSRPLAVSSTPASPISPANQISVVDASQLPTLPASEPQPLPAGPSSPPSPPVAPSAVLPETPIPETSNRLINEAVPEAVSYSDIVPATTPSADPAGSTPVTPIDEATIRAEWEYLASYLKDQDEGFGFTLFDILENFGETGQANQFFYEKNQPRLEVSSFYHFPEQTPEQVFQDVVMPELSGNTGFDPQRQEDFPAGLAYQLLQGEILRYLIIVKLREDEGSVLMLSESLPRLES